MRNLIRDEASELFNHVGDNAVVFDGFDDALIGHGRQHPNHNVLVYSAQRIIDLLIHEHGMTHEEASEYYGRNIECLDNATGTPIIVWLNSEEDWKAKYDALRDKINNLMARLQKG